MDRIETENNMPSKAVQNAAKTAIIMAVLLLCSKLLGFVREMVMAAFFGTSYIVDAYVMAQSIPNMLFLGVFLALATAYMPLLSECMEKGSQEEGNRFTSRVINIVLIVSAISALVGLLFSDQLTSLMARGFTGETAELTSRYLKITFTYTMFSATAAILETYLQYKGTFIPQIVIGYTQNIIMIATIVICAYTSFYFLAYGLLIAYILRMILLYLVATRKEYRYSFKAGNYRETFGLIMPLAIPVFIGSCTNQINTFVDKYLASSLAIGSVSALNYASILNTTIMTISVSVINTIIYPKLSQTNASGKRDSMVAISQLGVSLSILIALPFSFGAVVYSDEIVQILFERGAFDNAATNLTQGAYRFYSIGMVFMALNLLLTNIYYALKDTRHPMYFAMLGVIVNICVNLLLVDSMQHRGLAFGTSCATICNTLLLCVGLHHYYKINIILDWKKVGRFFIATVVAVVLSYIIYRGLIAFIWMPRMVYLGIAVCIAIVIYIFILKIMKIEELSILTSLIKTKTIKGD